MTRTCSRSMQLMGKLLSTSEFQKKVPWQKKAKFQQKRQRSAQFCHVKEQKLEEHKQKKANIKCEQGHDDHSSIGKNTKDLKEEKSNILSRALFFKFKLTRKALKR